MSGSETILAGHTRTTIIYRMIGIVWMYVLMLEVNN